MALDCSPRKQFFTWMIYCFIFLIYFILFFFIFYLGFTALQEYFTYIELGVHQRWAKTGEPGEKPPDHP